MTREPPIFDPHTVERARRVAVALTLLATSLAFVSAPRVLAWLIQRCC